MNQQQTVLEDGGQAVRKKPRSCRRPLLFLLLLCLLGILYGFDLTDASSTWTDQLWTTYFNATALGANRSNQPADSLLTRLLPGFIGEWNKTRTLTTEPEPSPPTPPPPPRPSNLPADSPLIRLFPGFIGKRTKTTTLTTEPSPPAPPPSNQPTDTHRTLPSPSVIHKRTESKTATTEPPPPPPPPPPRPEYKSPGPYLVEYPYKYNFIIDEAKTCQEVKPFLVLIVPVAPQNKADRQIIRDTWGGQKVVSGKKVALFFLLGLGKADGKDLLEESKQNGDILQSDFVDCYKNLTIKTMVMLEWLDSHCREAAYAMKVDSDMFLNLAKLMEMLQGAPRANYLTGLVERGAEVHRWKSKWFVPVEVFGGATYPPYVLGLGYVLSLDLARKLVEVSREVKALYIEDVYLGMCMQRLGLQPTEPPLRGAFHVFPLNYNRCQYSRIVASTVSEHTDRLQLWRDFTRPGPYC